jgi:uncharacterized protein (DUF433 family)
MAEASYQVVSGVESDIHDEPHVEGRRITVRFLQGLVEDEGTDPKAVADRYDLDLAAVYLALAYYHERPDEMARVERERRRTIEEARADAITVLDDIEQ